MMPTVRKNTAILAASLGAAVLGGCYGHHVKPEIGPPTAARVRPPLLAPMSGHYTIERAGTRIGDERFTVTSSAGIWRVEGRVELASPTESTHGYVLTIDEATAEPVEFFVWFEMFGGRREAYGQRTPDGYVHVEMSGVGGAGAKDVPYAAGTTIAYDTPLFSTLALSLLLAGLEVGASVSVRTIVLPLPDLAPSVLLSTYALSEREGDVAKIVMTRPRTQLPVAMWVRRDGLPVRVRTYIAREAPPIERHLVE